MPFFYITIGTTRYDHPSITKPTPVDNYAALITTIARTSSILCLAAATNRGTLRNIKLDVASEAALVQTEAARAWTSNIERFRNSPPDQTTR